MRSGIVVHRVEHDILRIGPFNIANRYWWNDPVTWQFRTVEWELVARELTNVPVASVRVAIPEMKSLRLGLPRDSLSPTGIHYGWRFGVLDPVQIDQWFGSMRPQLSQLGFVRASYLVSPEHMRVGRVQVVFRPQHAMRLGAMSL